MTISWEKIATVTFLALATLVSSGQIKYLPKDKITTAWKEFTGGVDAGNGVFLSPDGNMAVVVSRDAFVRAFDAATGAQMWSFSPTGISTSTSGAFFSLNGTTPYIAISVVTGENK